MADAAPGRRDLLAPGAHGVHARAGGAGAGFKLVEPRHWPLALAVFGAGYLSLAKDRFAPALAVALFMEAAIPMSKIDPGAIKFAGSPAH